MNLTTENVDLVMRDVLYKDHEVVDGQVPEGAVVVKGLIHDFGFHPERLEARREDVKSMLLQLPNDFMKSGGQGASFFGACMTKDGELWGQHRDIELLLCLGLGLKLAKFVFGRDMWQCLPGGMPYFFVEDA